MFVSRYLKRRVARHPPAIWSDVSSDANGTIVCVAYPASDVKKSANFQAAALSVSELKEANTASKCLSVAEPPPHTRTSRTEMVNGVEFNVTKTDGVAERGATTWTSDSDAA